MMACEICGKSSCTRSFHSIEAQEDFDARQAMSSDVDELRCEIEGLRRGIAEIRAKTLEVCANICDEVDGDAYGPAGTSTGGVLAERIRSLKEEAHESHRR